MKNYPINTPNQHQNLFSTIKCSGLDKSYTLPQLPSTNSNVILDNLTNEKNVKVDVPLLPLLIEKVDVFNNLNTIIEEPVISGQIEKHAIVMIIRRRKKMKKHKLKKLRIKMKFEWAKIRQKREMRKEKAFQLELSSKVKEGERFNAEQYVDNKLNLLHSEPLEERWKNVPTWFIKEWTDRKKRVRSERAAKKERKKALPSLLVKYWGVDFQRNQ